MIYDTQIGSSNITNRNIEVETITKKKQVLSESSLYNLITNQTGNEEVADFINSQINLDASSRIMLLTKQKVNFQEENIDNLRAVVNLKPLNKFQDVNSYFLTMRTLIPDTGIFIGCIETYNERKKRFKKGFRSFWKIAYTIDFIINRVLPRLLIIEKIYTYLTKDSFHIMSKAEILGRLVYSGFSIIDFRVINGLLYYVAMNTHEPSTRSVTKYPFIKLRRVGKNGNMIGVYKFRTMHPYSEYLQKFIIDLNGYNEVGKPANDFRLTSWGKFLRKVWLDEFPQLINVVKGQMKIVGVRPLSETRFNELPKEVQEARIKHKPGCFPPYVALNMPSSTDNILAEIIYMKEKEEKPYTTDIKFLFKSVFNILTNKIRSS